MQLKYAIIIYLVSDDDDDEIMMSDVIDVSVPLTPTLIHCFALLLCFVLTLPENLPGTVLLLLIIIFEFNKIHKIQDCLLIILRVLTVFWVSL